MKMWQTIPTQRVSARFCSLRCPILTIFLLLALLVLAPLYGQANLGVDAADPVYQLLDSAAMKGYLTDLSHYRPYSAKQVYRYLQQIEGQGALTSAERTVLGRELARFRGIIAPAEADHKFTDFLKDATVALSRDANLPLALRLEFELKNRLEFVSREPYLFDVMRLYLEGDISPFFSYQATAGTGFILVKTASFAPYAYVPDVDGHAISAGNIQAGEVSFSGERPSLALQFGGKMAASFWGDRVRTSFGYRRRNIGIANSSLIYSGQASPILAWDLSLRPFKWAALNFMVGGLNGEGNDSTAKAMFTAQQFEFFLSRYFYFGITMASVWIKRLEPYYMMPFLPVAFGQSLLGDYDNLAIQATLALKLPYVTIYGVGLADEVQPADVANLFSSLTQQFAFQAGIQVLLPGIPFTTFAFQYTRIEPYTYTHYAQKSFQGSSKGYGTINLSWMNNQRNLGYHLPPNSDEFLLRLESQPLGGWRFALGYQHIRHGDGDRRKGQVEGRSNAVYENTVRKRQQGDSPPTTDTEDFDLSKDQIYTGIYAADWYFSDENTKGKRPRKKFLQDGVYEYIHIVRLDVAYRFRKLPLEAAAHVVFSRNDGPVYNGAKGTEEIRFALGLDLRFYGKARR